MFKFKKSNLRVAFALGILILVAFAIRIANLTILPVFADEAIYIRWSQIMSHEATLRFLPLSDGKQPLFMWILMLIIKFFSDPLFAGRIISVFFGIGSIIGVFCLSFILFNSKKAALLSSLLLTFSPFVVFFDRMALVGSTLTFFGIWTAVFSVLAAKTEKFFLWIFAGFSLGFASLTKSPALFFAIMMPISLIFSNIFATRKLDLKKLIIVSGQILFAYILAFGMYNILRLGPNFHLLAMRNYDYVYPYSHILTDTLNPLKGHLGGIYSYYILLAPVGAFLAAIFGGLVNFSNYKKSVLFLLIWWLFPTFLVAEYSKVVTARYVLFTIPFLLVLAGSSILETRKKLSKLAAILFIVFIAQSIYTDFFLLTDVARASLPYGDRSGYLEEWTAGTGIKEISEIIKSEAKGLPAGRQVVVGTEGYFGTLPDGLEIYTQDTENVVVIGVGLGINEIPSQLSESKAAGNKTYLVINKSRLAADPKKLNLKLIEEYPKEPRRQGSLESDLYGDQEILYLFEVN